MFLPATITLAIAPITKRYGVAVFENAELIYFGVITVKSNKITQSLRTRISQTVLKLIKEFKPDFVVVKTLNKQQEKSKNLRLAIRQIKSKAEICGIPVSEVSFEAVKKLLCGDQKPTIDKRLQDNCNRLPRASAIFAPAK